jgi:hypothetical protein
MRLETYGEYSVVVLLSKPRCDPTMILTVLMDNNTYIDQYYLGEPAFSVYIAYKRLSSFYIRRNQDNCRHPH